MHPQARGVAGISTLGGTNSLLPPGYSDLDYANCIVTNPFIGGYCFTVSLGMISWSSKKQATVTNSSCYTEYTTLHNASHEVTFLHQRLKGLHLLPANPAQLFSDNDTTSHLAEYHVWHSNTKHICVKYHSRELMIAGDLTVQCMGTKENITNILTKPLSHVDFQQLHHYFGVRPPA